ncbi:RAD52 family DNA repair protein [Nitratireductor aquimarinus]|uniref:RAD52 family DNA repair protein n=1 Tax=Alphaproteobacteria TaxID=28211 RepID=UPI0019D3A657|nr:MULTISPECIES: RAD52 family DNA repair protein [Alphaproteobacteria]MBN7755452.1 RAD52 family DNA repair protein [Nitratireductor aquimarinus]MBY5998207.1 RAD52 family DNA repair protein [Tritonibacter mobilis]MBY6020234.1 RAD52 family DNA repair protein [Nitratireductor sp. DP7N14-4]
MTFTTDQKSLLEAKLDPSHVKPPQQFGPKGDYLEGWHVIAEANRIFGFDGWSYEVVDVKCVSEAPRKIGRQQKDGWGVTYTARVKAIVSGVIREDCGAGHGYDVDAGLAHESAIKEAVTDALKRAMRTFGNPFGLALYDKTRANVGTAEEAPSRQQQEPAPKASSAAQKRGLEDIERDLLDCKTVQNVRACANSWKHIFDRDGWAEDFTTLAGDKFRARIAEIKQAEAEDVFPGDQKDIAA